MNRNVAKAQEDIKKVDAIMSAIEKSYLNIEVVPEEYDRKCTADYLFYALWDAIKKVVADIDRLEGDEMVVGAIEAINKAKNNH